MTEFMVEALSSNLGPLLQWCGDFGQIANTPRSLYLSSAQRIKWSIACINAQTTGIAKIKPISKQVPITRERERHS